MEKSDLPDFAQTVANLRNAKDHIAQRIRNFANSKNMPPINVLVRWTFNPRIEAEEFVISVQVFTVDPTLKEFTIPTADGIGGNARAFDHLALFAFDDCLQVSRAYDVLEGFIVRLNENLTASIVQAECDGAPKKTELSEAEQRPFCVVIEGRCPI